MVETTHPAFLLRWEPCAYGVKGEFADVPGVGRFTVIKTRARRTWSAHFNGRLLDGAYIDFMNIDDAKAACARFLKAKQEVTGLVLDGLLWQANLEYRDENGVKSTTIQFVSTNKETAFLDVFRWWMNRHKAIPEWFQTLYAFKLWGVQPQRLDKTGYLPPSNGLFGAEWKYDSHPWPEEIER